MSPSVPSVGEWLEVHGLPFLTSGANVALEVASKGVDGPHKQLGSDVMYYVTNNRKGITGIRNQQA